MRISARQFRLAAVASLIAVLSSCGHAATKLAIDDRATPTPTSATMPTTTTTVPDELGVWLHGVAVAKWNAAVWKNAVGVAAHREAQVRHALSSSASPVWPTPTANIAAIMQCIRDHESGRYDEHSHLQDGSGAYQMVPGTFRHYEAAAGFSGYAYAYQAPAAVQDAIVVYALTHGGAGNWSDRFGNDPCTSSLPGGG